MSKQTQYPTSISFKTALIYDYNYPYILYTNLRYMVVLWGILYYGFTCLEKKLLKPFRETVAMGYPSLKSILAISVLISMALGELADQYSLL